MKREALQSTIMLAATVAIVFAIASFAKADTAALPIQYNETLARKLLSIAAIAKCNESNIIDWSCKTCADLPEVRPLKTYYVAKHDVVFGNWLSYIAIDTALRQIIVVVRSSTLAGRNLATDVSSIVSVPLYDDGGVSALRVGYGFKNAADELIKLMDSDINELVSDERFADFGILVLGHSFGGATASIIAVKRFRQYGQRVSLVTFEAPRAGNAAFAAARMSSFRTSWRVTNGKDPIIHLPPKVQIFKNRRFAHPGHEYWYPPSEEFVPGSYVYCENGEDSRCAQSVRDALEPAFAFPPKFKYMIYHHRLLGFETIETC